MKRLAVMCLALAGCASLGGASSGDGNNTDAPSGCSITLTFNPASPHAGATVRAAASVNGAPGVLSYAWDVSFNGASVSTTPASSDGSQIDFLPVNPGVYLVGVDVGLGPNCTGGSQTLNVLAPGANVADYRLHVVPPSGLAPPQDTIIEVDGGAAARRDVAIDPGVSPALQIFDGITGVAAYVRFTSTTSPAAVVEDYAASDGNLTPNLLGQPYNVLIIPSSPSYAPMSGMWQPGAGLPNVNAGETITGTVLAPNGSPLAGAVVQLSSGGVPSTIGATASDGTFSVRADFPSATVTVDVVPPAGRGLPRLTAGGAFDTLQPVQIHYAAALATCNASGALVQRGGTTQPNAKVIVVGTLASAGTVTAGVSGSASGSVQIAVTADATGHLPSTLVPKASLAAVEELAANEVALAPFDESACGATAIAAPAQKLATGTVTDDTSVALPGARVSATPVGSLGLAGEPAVEVLTDGTGHFSLPLAGSGTYDLRASDPLGRAAPITALATAAGSVPSVLQLVKSLNLTGMATVTGSANPVAGAAIQILCASCSGLDALRPIAETATDGTSMYSLAVPDPGTM